MCLGLLANIILDSKKLDRDKRSSLFCKGVNYKEKSFMISVAANWKRNENIKLDWFNDFCEIVNGFDKT